jgi:ComF family protein
MRTVATSWINGVRDWVLPGRCLACDEPVGQRQAVCDACDVQLKELRQRPRCIRCAALLPDGAECGTCNAKGVRPFELIAAIYAYDGPARELVLATKFGGKWWCGEWLGKELAASQQVADILATAQVLVPVPLHWWRNMWRGFNQSQMIAKGLVRYSDATIKPRVLKRSRRTRPQSVLSSRKQRTENVKDAFVLRDAKAIEGKHVVLIDDIFTTGATLRAAARALQRAKPLSINAIVVCVADRSGSPRVR